MIKKKLILLSYPFWSYKEIATFYEMSNTRAIKVKKEVELEELKRKNNTINNFNSDFIETHLIIEKMSKMSIDEKIQELSFY